MVEESLLNDLYSEYVQFYENLANKNEHIPRSISGVDKNGVQFIFDMKGFNLDHLESDTFIKVILKEEKSTYFAYGTLVASYNEKTNNLDEELLITSASAERYIQGDFSVLRSESGRIVLTSKGVWKGDDPAEHPGIWFLSKPPMLPDVDLEKYVRMWEASRNEAMFRQR